MNELLFNVMMIRTLIESFNKYKKNQKKLPVILIGLTFVICTLGSNLVQNHQTIQAANTLDMIVVSLFSFVVLSALIMLPIMLGLK